MHCANTTRGRRAETTNPNRMFLFISPQLDIILVQKKKQKEICSVESGRQISALKYVKKSNSFVFFWDILALNCVNLDVSTESAFAFIFQHSAHRTHCMNIVENNNINDYRAENVSVFKRPPKKTSVFTTILFIFILAQVMNDIFITFYENVMCFCSELHGEPYNLHRREKRFRPRIRRYLVFDI